MSEVTKDNLQASKIKLAQLREKTMDKYDILRQNITFINEFDLLDDPTVAEQLIQNVENTLFINKETMDVDSVFKTLKIQVPKADNKIYINVFPKEFIK